MHSVDLQCVLLDYRASYTHIMCVTRNPDSVQKCFSGVTRSGWNIRSHVISARRPNSSFWTAADICSYKLGACSRRNGRRICTQRRHQLWRALQKPRLTFVAAKLAENSQLQKANFGVKTSISSFDAVHIYSLRSTTIQYTCIYSNEYVHSAPSLSSF